MVTWPQVLAFRMRRQLLDPIGYPSVHDVVGRLCGVQSQVASSAELAIRIRRSESRSGEVARALSNGTLIKTWAMRGTIHLLTPESAPTFLSVIASGRSWTRGSWVKYFGVTPEQIESLRGVVREALAGDPLTRDELIAAVTKKRSLRHIGEALHSGWGTLLKPLAWQGDLCFGPSQGNRVTFTLPERASRHWPGMPDPEDSAPIAIASYLAAYGPTTPDAFSDWLAGGWFGKRQLHAWFSGLGDKVTKIEVEGSSVYVLSDDLDELAATPSTRAVRLLGGFDQYVLGPGTKDEHVVPSQRRGAVSKQSGWISPVVVTGGSVTGTWETSKNDLAVAWFEEAGRPPVAALRRETARLGEILGRRLSTKVDVHSIA